MVHLPDRASLEFLRKQAKTRKKERSIPLSRAQHEIARAYGFASWPSLVHHIQARELRGIERALVLADPSAIESLLRADPDAALAAVDGLAPLLVLLRRSVGTGARVRECARLLLDAGADPGAHTAEGRGEWRRSALFDAVERDDLALVRMLVERGAPADEDAFYHACEQSDTAFLDLLYQPGFERPVAHKLDFEDAPGLAWFLDRGADPSECLHHAIARGRGRPILTMLLDAGAEVNRPWCRWDVGRRPLALAARSGHLAAFELLQAGGATAELDEVDRAVLAVARGESVQLPTAPPPALGNPPGEDYGWVLGQFALLGRTEIVAALLDAGMAVDTRGWSNFTPLDCALWGVRNNRAHDGDYLGTVQTLLDADAPTRHTHTGDPAIDALLTEHQPTG